MLLKFRQTTFGSQRPSGPVSINRTSSQANGIVRAWRLNGNAKEEVAGINTAFYDPAAGGVPVFRTSTLGGMNLDVAGGLCSFNTNEFIQDLCIDGSIVIWAFPTGAYNASTQRFLWGQNGNATPEFSCQRYLDNKWYVGSTVGSDTRVSVLASAADWIQNAWNCYVFTWQTGDARWYANGQLVASNTNTQAMPTVKTAGCFVFGDGADSARVGGLNIYYRDFIAEPRIYNRALSATEVWQIYDPATRWDLYQMPSARMFYGTVAAAVSSRRPGGNITVPVPNHQNQNLFY